MFATSSIFTDTTLADGIINGYNERGVLIVSLRYMPTVERILGRLHDEADVKSWHVSPEGARRIAAIYAWNSTPGRPTAGCA